jgi:hypothetical protein
MAEIRLTGGQGYRRKNHVPWRRSDGVKWYDFPELPRLEISRAPRRQRPHAAPGAIRLTSVAGVLLARKRSTAIIELV